MTLAKRLREVIEKIDELDLDHTHGAQWYRQQITGDLRELISQVEDKVLVKPEIEEMQAGFKFKGRIGKDFAFGETEAEVAANLQEKVDAL